MQAKPHDIKLTVIKTKPSEAEIRRKLAILTNVARPISPTLPPSPPLSPKPLKRKSPDDGDTSSGRRVDGADPVKRAKTTADASPHSSSASSSSSRSGGSRSPPSDVLKKEDGEVTEQFSLSRNSRYHATGSMSGLPSSTPAPRPRRARIPYPSSDEVRKRGAGYLLKARTLKRSVAFRRKVASTSDADRITYIALEQVDSVLLFAYSFWNMAVNGQLDPGGWETLIQYMADIRSLWEKRVHQARAPPSAQPSKEYVMNKMVLGVLDMIKFCTLFHIHKYYSTKLQARQDSSSVTPNRSSTSPPGNFHLTPPPPYTSSASAQSRGSRTAVPSPASSSSSGQQRTSNAPNGSMQPPHAANGHSSSSVSPHQHSAAGGSPPGSVAVNADLMTLMHKVIRTSSQLADASGYGSLMTMHDLRKYFPVTYAVSAGDNASTGKPLRAGVRDDQFQVDLQACVQGRGEWAWPILTGDDVANVVGYGRSILWEYGQGIPGGYKGCDGVWKHWDVPGKPNGVEFEGLTEADKLIE